MTFERFQLDAKAHDRVSEDIFSYYLAPFSASDFPHLVVLGGQPGSGKSFLAQYVLRQNKNMIFINGDELRSFHPDLMEISERHPLDTAAATDADVRKWTSELFEEARLRKLDILFEGTFRTPSICKTIDLFSSCGYSIDIILAAVHPLESRFSIFSRYVAQSASNGYARFTPASAHDAALESMADTLFQIVLGGKVNSILVLDRNGADVKMMRKCENNIDSNHIIDALRIGRERFFESGRFEKTFSSIENIYDEIKKQVREHGDRRLIDEFKNFIVAMEKERLTRAETTLGEIIL